MLPLAMQTSHGGKRGLLELLDRAGRRKRGGQTAAANVCLPLTQKNRSKGSSDHKEQRAAVCLEGIKVRAEYPLLEMPETRSTLESSGMCNICACRTK